MSDYQVKSQNTLLFELTQGERLIGKLTYKNWFSFGASIETADHSVYQVKQKGFWGTTIELKQEDHVLVNFKMNWRGEIVIQTFFKNLEKGYLFKHRGVFKESFLLLDQEGTELLVMKPHIKWGNLTYEYQITTADSFELTDNPNILLIGSVHCANYYMSMMSGVG